MSHDEFMEKLNELSGLRAAELVAQAEAIKSFMELTAQFEAGVETAEAHEKRVEDLDEEIKTLISEYFVITEQLTDRFNKFAS